MIEQTMGYLKKFTSLCTLTGQTNPSASDHLEPHSVNQQILYNAQVGEVARRRSLNLRPGPS